VLDGVVNTGSVVDVNEFAAHADENQQRRRRKSSQKPAAQNVSVESIDN